MKKVIVYKGRSYKAIVTEWTNGQTTATVKMFWKEVLLTWSMIEGEGRWANV